MATAQTLLDAVDTAIAARLAGNAVQSYSTDGGINIQYMNLRELREFRAELIQEVSAEQSTSNRTFADFAEAD